MADWQRHLELQPEWDMAKDGGITIHELARVIAQRLRNLRPFVKYPEIDEGRLEIAEEFETIADDPSLTTEEFDSVMERLWDWGDISFDGEFNGRKVCWINTLFTKNPEPTE